MQTILIIEDQPDMRENIATILAAEGYEVIAAADGSEGIVAARESKPDLIVCDVMMAPPDGHYVLHAVRSDRSICGTPFIFLTARGEKQDQRIGMNLGADDYLIKPVAAEDLLGAVAARLAREQERFPNFLPDFTSATPLQKAFDLTPREAEVLLWIAQGKSNPETGAILGAAENTIKVHLTRVFEKMGAGNRHAAMLMALEVLGRREFH